MIQKGLFESYRLLHFKEFFLWEIISYFWYDTLEDKNT